MAQFFPTLPEGVPKILDLHDVHSLMMRRGASSLIGEARRQADYEAMRTLKFERRVCAQADLCVVCSLEEARAAQELLGIDHLAVIPNGVDTRWFEPSSNEPVPGYLLFTGSMNYEPNIQAVQFFAHEILPQIAKQVVGTRFHIVGANPSQTVRTLADTDVVVHGTVEDMRPFFRNASVVVVPLLHGGGTRLKVLEAAAAGKAIVSTSLGAEGLDFTSGVDLLLADSPDDFASSVIDLLRNSVKRQSLQMNARQTALRYHWDEITARFLHNVSRYLDS
jgi:glycosyltransferase involved in cell wall biosynthesis